MILLRLANHGGQVPSARLRRPGELRVERFVRRTQFPPSGIEAPTARRHQEPRASPEEHGGLRCSAEGGTHGGS